MINKEVFVKGAGLAGGISGWQVAYSGISVKLIEMRPLNPTPIDHIREFEDLDFGVKATLVTAMRPLRGQDKGQRDVTLNIGGIQIRSGDYCYADRDCVIVLDNPVHV